MKRGTYYLFDSSGRNVAEMRSATLFAPDGTEIGMYLNAFGVIVGFDGRYLGEVVQDDRLYCRTNRIGEVLSRDLQRRPRPVGHRPGTLHRTAYPRPLPPGYSDIPAEHFRTLGGKRAA
ncbi:hypothetical protein [Wenxinia saemankumensis]|uniref:Uncharacterized protein n=1 Tax=Wenxinia saemankumensis TaxID=1447782 RepID=A0A1M6HRT9_9RHOB|nr:hypothetical protein [Wenxinia saemankumensis]SHJ24919.1 hypothetical protein SAMN05444417_3321 [Wenxinia saemankumensis]